MPQKSLKSSQTDLNLLDLLQNSIKVFWKYKWLWVYGALLSSSTFENVSKFSRNSENNKNSLENLPAKIEEGTKVLGAATNQIKDWFSSVSPLVWIVLVVGILVVAIMAIGVKMSISSWANASLVLGLKFANINGKVTLRDTAKDSKRKLIPLLKFQLLLFGISVALLGGGVLVSSIFFILKLPTVIPILVLIMSMLLFVVWIVLIAFSSQFCERYVVLENLNAKDALKRGIALFRKNKKITILTKLMHLIISLILSSIISAFLYGATLSSAFNTNNTDISFFTNLAIFIGSASIFSTVAMTLLVIFMSVVSANNWNVIFEKLNKK